MGHGCALQKLDGIVQDKPLLHSVGEAEVRGQGLPKPGLFKCELPVTHAPIGVGQAVILHGAPLRAALQHLGHVLIEPKAHQLHGQIEIVFNSAAHGPLKLSGACRPIQHAEIQRVYLQGLPEKRLKLPFTPRQLRQYPSPQCPGLHVVPSPVQALQGELKSARKLAPLCAYTRQMVVGRASRLSAPGGLE